MRWLSGEVKKDLKDLGNSNISGTLGSELGELKHLQYLELYRNEIGGKIPKALGKLKNLVSMDLYEKRFEGEIPKSLSKLKSLRFLRLSNNKLTGSIPRELTNLSNLKVFDVSNNNLCGTVPVDGPFATFPMERYLPSHYSLTKSDIYTRLFTFNRVLGDHSDLLIASFPPSKAWNKSLPKG
ncbi:leucine-rich repeat protein 2-like [Carya illinoinensis]|uniref:leucine-rich repeat protein 2-like n=1 Tax=Carya illinoinensis TaxID=32201 RepID=UPI001C728851|nr:leucine-rich repeat protein 2-like [Carya illinoinensis]